MYPSCQRYRKLSWELTHPCTIFRWRVRFFSRSSYLNLTTLSSGASEISAHHSKMSEYYILPGVRLARCREFKRSSNSKSSTLVSISLMTYLTYLSSRICQYWTLKATKSKSITNSTTSRDSNGSKTSISRRIPWKRPILNSTTNWSRDVVPSSPLWMMKWLLTVFSNVKWARSRLFSCQLHELWTSRTPYLVDSLS